MHVVFNFRDANNDHLLGFNQGFNQILQGTSCLDTICFVHKYKETLCVHTHQKYWTLRLNPARIGSPR